MKTSTFKDAVCKFKDKKLKEQFQKARREKRKKEKEAKERKNIDDALLKIPKLIETLSKKDVGFRRYIEEAKKKEEVRSIFSSHERESLSKALTGINEEFLRFGASELEIDPVPFPVTGPEIQHATNLACIPASKIPNAYFPKVYAKTDYYIVLIEKAHSTTVGVYTKDRYTGSVLDRIPIDPYDNHEVCKVILRLSNPYTLLETLFEYRSPIKL